jgi:Ca2+-binding EF-hand superfamily protein
MTDTEFTLPPLYNFVGRGHGPTRPRRKLPAWQQTAQEEQVARQRVVRLRREVQRASERTAAEHQQARAREGAQAVRTQMEQERAGDILAALSLVDPADAERVRDLSERLNGQLETLADPRARSWYSLFKHMDEGDTGRISYAAFVQMARRRLKLGDSEEALQGVWRALDEEGAGSISVGAFATFMRKGRSEAPAGPSTSWKERLRLSKSEGARAVRTQMEDERGGQALLRALSLVEPADAERVRDLSERLNGQLETLADPRARSWYSLLQHMDEGDTGRIS